MISNAKMINSLNIYRKKEDNSKKLNNKAK